MVKDIKSAVNKEYLNSKFLKKDGKDGNYFDLKQKVIKILSRIMMDCSKKMILFRKNMLIKKTVSKILLLLINLVKLTLIKKTASKILLLLVKPTKQHVLLHDGSVNMSGNLNMNSKSIIHVKDISNLPQ